MLEKIFQWSNSNQCCLIPYKKCYFTISNTVFKTKFLYFYGNWPNSFRENFFFFISYFFSLKVSLIVSQRCSVKKVSLKISKKSQENDCPKLSFRIKLQAWGVFYRTPSRDKFLDMQIFCPLDNLHTLENPLSEVFPLSWKFFTDE